MFGPVREIMPDPLTRLVHAQRPNLLGLTFEVVSVPGHTSGHIAYDCADMAPRPLLFYGDTLFSSGCGSLIECTPDQMLASLDTLAALPPATLGCCMHEHTLSNLKFALAVDPHNQALIDYTVSADALRASHNPAVPSNIGLERQTNSFLHTREPALIDAVQLFNASAKGEGGIFAALRQWKNKFQ